MVYHKDMQICVGSPFQMPEHTLEVIVGSKFHPFSNLDKAEGDFKLTSIVIIVLKKNHNKYWINYNSENK